MTELLSVNDALEAVLGRAEPLDAESVALAEASGRVLAEDARALVDLPPFPSSAMDGFTVRAADTPGRLPVVERIAAGRPAPRALQAGETMGIATGGVVPEGADAVVPIERVTIDGDQVEIVDPQLPAPTSGRAAATWLPAPWSSPQAFGRTAADRRARGCGGR